MHCMFILCSQWTYIVWALHVHITQPLDMYALCNHDHSVSFIIMQPQPHCLSSDLHLIAEGVFWDPLMVVHFQAKPPKLAQDRRTGAGGVEGPRPNVLVHVYEIPHGGVYPPTGRVVEPGWVQGLYMFGDSFCLH